MEVPPARSFGVRSQGRTPDEQDWRERAREAVENWKRGGTPVSSRVADSRAYLRHYAARHGAYFEGLRQEVRHVLVAFFVLLCFCISDPFV